MSNNVGRSSGHPIDLSQQFGRDDDSLLGRVVSNVSHVAASAKYAIDHPIEAGIDMAQNAVSALNNSFETTQLRRPYREDPQPSYDALFLLSQKYRDLLVKHNNGTAPEGAPSKQKCEIIVKGLETLQRNYVENAKGSDKAAILTHFLKAAQELEKNVLSSEDELTER